MRGLNDSHIFSPSRPNDTYTHTQSTTTCIPTLWLVTSHFTHSPSPSLFLARSPHRNTLLYFEWIRLRLCIWENVLVKFCVNLIRGAHTTQYFQSYVNAFVSLLAVVFWQMYVNQNEIVGPLPRTHTRAYYVNTFTIFSFSCAFSILIFNYLLHEHLNIRINITYSERQICRIKRPIHTHFSYVRLLLVRSCSCVCSCETARHLCLANSFAFCSSVQFFG